MFDPHKVGLVITQEDYQWLDFAIEKTHTAFYDAGKKFEKFFGTYLVFLILSAIVTYGRGIGADAHGTESGVKIPLLELVLDRRYAAIALVVLSTAVLLALVCQVVYEEVLRWRTEGLILIRYGQISKVGDVPDDEYWYLRYPSLFRMSLFLSSSYRVGAVFGNAFLVIMTAGLFLPAVLAWHVGTELSWPRIAKVGLIIGVSILPSLSILLLSMIFPRSQAAAAIYTKLQDHFREQAPKA